MVLSGPTLSVLILQPLGTCVVAPVVILLPCKAGVWEVRGYKHEFGVMVGAGCCSCVCPPTAQGMVGLWRSMLQ